MTNETIIDVHSISTAQGWVFSDGTQVACFALVTTMRDLAHGLSEKIIIPVRDTDLHMNLIGKKVDIAGDDVSYIGAI